MSRIVTIAVALALSATFAGPVAAGDDDGRQPSAAELEQIEAALAGAGFEGWEEIELDDGLWEIDDARREGQDYDVKVHPKSFEIVSVED